MNHLKTLAKQTVIYGLSQMLGRFLNYLLVPLHTAVLGAFYYGQITYIYGFFAILLVMLTYGMETGFFRFASNSKENYKEVLGTSFYTVLATTALFFFLTFIFRNNISNSLKLDLSPNIVLLFISIISLDVINSIPFAKLRIDERPIKFMFVRVVGIVVNVLLNVFYLIICRNNFLEGSENVFAHLFDEGRLVEYVLIANLVSSIVMTMLLMPELFGVKPVFSFDMLKKIFRYSFPILLIGLTGIINDNIDKILIPELINSDQPIVELGIYGANFKLAVIMVLFIQMFRYAAEPFFFKNASENNSKLIYSQVMTYFIVFGLFIFLAVMFYMDIFKYFIDESFWEGLKVVPILLIAKLIFGILFTLSIWYKISDRTIFGTYIAVIGVVITIVLNVILIPRFGYIGSAIASLVSYSAMLIASYLLSLKHFKIDYDFRKIFFYIVMAGILLLLFFLNPFEQKFLFFGLNTLLLVVYIVVVYVKEKSILKDES